MQKREEWIMTVQERERMLDLVEILQMLSDTKEYHINSHAVQETSKEILSILHGEWTPKN